MSNLILEWLDSLNLSRRIEGFGSTFQDGFVLGEILYKYNQQRDFDLFVSQGTTSNTLHNFQLLDSSLRLIGVRFNSQIAGEIMRANDNTVKTLLYELKVSLERITRNSRQSTSPLLWGTRNDKILSVIGTTRPAFDSSRAQTVSRGIQGVLDNPNTVMMKSALKRFTDHEQHYNETKRIGDEHELNTRTLHRLRAKDIYKSRREHEGDFKEAWDAVNLDQWKINQKIAHDRKALRETINSNIREQRNKQVQKLKNEVKSYAVDSMNAFDQRLETLIITNDSSESHSNSGSPSKSMIRTVNIKG